MIDSHAHLHDPAFDADRDLVVRRAKEAGVKKIVTIGTSIEESRKAVACANQYEGVFASIGIHPHEFGGAEYTDEEVDVWMEKLEEMAGHAKVVAIGECGLDYFSRDPEQPIGEEERSRQKNVFRKQINLAKKLDLPVIVHCRDAYEDLTEMLREISDGPKVVVHCHEGGMSATKMLLDLGCFFSFTGNITYKERIGSDRNEMLRSVPLERMMIETDCPYLSPVPHRGKRNEPANVALVAKKIAEIKGVSEEEVKKSTSLHAENVFSLI